MAYIYLLLLGVFGFSLTARLPVKLYRGEFIAMAAVLGLFVGGWITWIFSWVAPYSLSIPSAFLVLLVISLLALKTKVEVQDFKGQSVVWLVSTGILSGIVGYLLYTHMLMPQSDGWHSYGGAWGDMALHATLLNYFASGEQFSFQFPLLSGASLTYPFLIDFLSSVFFRMGMSTHMAFFLPGLVLSWACIQLLFFFSLRLFKKVGSAVLGLYIFFLNGSFASSWYAFQEWKQSGQGVIDFFRTIPRDYTNWAENGLYFTNFITTHLIPQRSILFGLGVFLVVAILWLEAFKQELADRRLLFATAVLVGLLPFAHAHTFLVLGLFLFGLALVKSWQSKSLLNMWVYSGLIAICIALPQVWWQSTAVLREGFGHWYMGWMRDPSESLLGFWARNFGISIVALVGLGILVMREKYSEFAVWLYTTSALLFIAANVYIFQPFAYDNLKILVYWYLILSVFAGYYLAKWFSTNWTGKIFVSLLVVATCLPGVLSLAKESQETVVLFTKNDIAFANEVKKQVPSEAVVLAGATHNHPVSALAGRKVVMGYPGWLWTYGLEYLPVENDVRAMFSDPLTYSTLYKKHNVSYVVIGPEERRVFGANPQLFKQYFQSIYEKNGWLLLKVR